MKTPEELLHLLTILDLAHRWPELHPIHNEVLGILREESAAVKKQQDERKAKAKQDLAEKSAVEQKQIEGEETREAFDPVNKFEFPDNEKTSTVTAENRDPNVADVARRSL